MQHSMQSDYNPDVLLIATALTSGGCSKALICNFQAGRSVSVPITLTKNCNFASEV